MLLIFLSKLHWFADVFVFVGLNFSGEIDIFHVGDVQKTTSPPVQMSQPPLTTCMLSTTHTVTQWGYDLHGDPTKSLS